MTISDELRALGPTVIGATGGSGTRVVARIARRAGMYIGTNLNAAEDAREMHRLAHRINVFVTHDPDRLPRALHDEMVRDLDAAVAAHLAPLEGTVQPWGWKNPRSIYLLPFFHEQFPAMKFVHVLRDGRDMAFSENQNQLVKHGATMLRRKETGWSEPLQSIALWSRVNQRAADYGESRMGGRYLRVRFEDLCNDPVPTTQLLLDFIGLTGDAQEIARQEVAPLASIGRWRQQDPATIAAMHRVGREALVRFGYPVEADASADGSEPRRHWWNNLALGRQRSSRRGAPHA